MKDNCSYCGCSVMEGIASEDGKILRLRCRSCKKFQDENVSEDSV